MRYPVPARYAEPLRGSPDELTRYAGAVEKHRSGIPGRDTQYAKHRLMEPDICLAQYPGNVFRELPVQMAMPRTRRLP